METTDQENEKYRPLLSEAELEETYDMREAEYDRAVRVILAFERQSSPALTAYTDTERHTTWIREDGVYVVRDPMDPAEKKELDDAVKITEAFEFDYHKESFDCYDYLEEHGGVLPGTQGYTLSDLEEMREGVEAERLAKQRGRGERSEAGLSREQIGALRDMGDIRQAHHEPGPNRLAAFEKGLDAKEETSGPNRMIREGRAFPVNGELINTGKGITYALIGPDSEDPEQDDFDKHGDEKGDVRNEAQGLWVENGSIMGSVHLDDVDLNADKGDHLDLEH